MNLKKNIKSIIVILSVTFGCSAINVLAFEAGINMYAGGHFLLFCLIIVADACLCLLLLMGGLYLLGKIFGIGKLKG